MLTSHMCREADFSADWYGRWHAVHLPQFGRHRKNWETSYICQALAERDLLRPGRRGLGLAVGQEALPALFAAQGATILATDLDPELAAPDGWVRHNHHCAGFAQLWNPGLLAPELFQQRCQFRPLDLRRLPDDLGTFDFLWSCSSVEHLDDFDAGLRVLEETLRYLTPGGWAVHTTEYNVSSNDATITRGRAVRGGGWPYVVYRRRDLEALAARLALAGHTLVDLDFDAGDGPWDRVAHGEHAHPFDWTLKIDFDGFVQTSFGLIIRKAA